MLKLIRLNQDRDLFTVQGFGVPAGKIPLGSCVDAMTLLLSIGVPPQELRVAQEWMEARPDHNAVEFGVSSLKVICTMSVDTLPILQAAGLTFADVA